MISIFFFDILNELAISFLHHKASPTKKSRSLLLAFFKNSQVLTAQGQAANSSCTIEGDCFLSFCFAVKVEPKGLGLIVQRLWTFFFKCVTIIKGVMLNNLLLCRRKGVSFDKIMYSSSLNILVLVFKCYSMNICYLLSGSESKM